MAASLSILVAASAAAQDSVKEHNVSGPASKDITAGWFGSLKGDCTTQPPPQARVVKSAKNGTIRLTHAKVRPKSIPRCANAEISAVVVLYKASEQFHGKDIFTIEVTAADGKTSRHRFNVAVAGMVQ
jgi:hypothetical protein